MIRRARRTYRYWANFKVPLAQLHFLVNRVSCVNTHCQQSFCFTKISAARSQEATKILYVDGLSGEHIEHSVDGSSCDLHNVVCDILSGVRSTLRHVG